MNRIYTYIFLLFFGVSFSQNLKNKSAADEIISQIEQIEKGYGYNIKLPNSIACLTGIYPKKVDGTYLGISFFPSESEIQLWKDWFEKNKTKISFSIESEIYNREFGGKVIKVEYESGKFRNNVCDEDKAYQDWLKQNEKK